MPASRGGVGWLATLVLLALFPRDALPVLRYHGGGPDPLLQSLSVPLDPWVDVDLGGAARPAPGERPSITRLEHFVGSETALEVATKPHRVVPPSEGWFEATNPTGSLPSDALTWIDHLVGRERPSVVLASESPAGIEVEFSPLRSERERLARAWTEAPPGKRVFLSFAAPDLPTASLVSSALDQAGYTTFLYLEDATRPPWASSIEFARYFAHADHHLVLDTADARESVGVVEEALWYREVEQRKAEVREGWLELFRERQHEERHRVEIAKKNLNTFLDAMRGRESFEVHIDSSVCKVRVDQAGAVRAPNLGEGGLGSLLPSVLEEAKVSEREYLTWRAGLAQDWPKTRRDLEILELLTGRDMTVGSGLLLRPPHMTPSEMEDGRNGAVPTPRNYGGTRPLKPSDLELFPPSIREQIERHHLVPELQELPDGHEERNNPKESRSERIRRTIKSSEVRKSGGRPPG